MHVALVRVLVPMYEPVEVTKCKRCSKIIAESKELIRIGRRMFTSKIKTRHWVLFILLMVALVLSLVALALSMGEQYHVVPEEFRLVFRLSILVSVILLLIGIKCFGRWRKQYQK